MPKLFDELDAIPEPGQLRYGSCALSTEPPVCLNCRQPVEQPGWHLIPDTGEYTCQ